MTADADDIDVRIAQLMIEIARLRDREQHHRARAQGTGGNSLAKSARGAARWQMKRAVEEREQAQRRLRALERQKGSDMGNADDVATTGLLELARLCDQQGRAFGTTLKKLHEGIVAARQCANGRGPSGILVWSALERASCQYFSGTPLRSLRSAPRIAGQPSFERQIEMWLPMLNAPPPSAAASPLSATPPAAA